MPQGINQTTSINTGAIATSTSALAANPNRRGWFIQNQDTTNPLFVCLGGTASSTVVHVILAKSTAATDGTGGRYEEKSGVVYTGAVTVYSAGTPSYTVIEH